VNRFKIIAFTHKNIDIKDIGRLHIEDAAQPERLLAVKKAVKAEELMFLSTCNRVEFLVSTPAAIDGYFLRSFFSSFESSWKAEDIQWAVEHAQVYVGEEALLHMFNVASSIDSLVVGEREIITQVRNAYEQCNKHGLTGDLIRLVIKKTIEAAKQVYTETSIAQKPVSVVSLAYRRLRDLNAKLDARFLIIGAGQTNILMAKFLKKHGFSNFTVFNRTLSNGQKLADELNGTALPLTDLKNYDKGFDIILTCTAAAEHIITPALYRQLLKGEQQKKIIIDLSVPNDIDPEVTQQFSVEMIDVSNLQALANINLQERKKELVACESILNANIEEFKILLKERKVELAMSEVPRKVKEIHQAAMQTVFAKDIEGLDENSKEVLEKILAYVEKKYISVPMKIAKDVLLNQH
jgi:glutamyl-tRNA reductase